MPMYTPLQQDDDDEEERSEFSAPEKRSAWTPYVIFFILSFSAIIVVVSWKGADESGFTIFFWGIFLLVAVFIKQTSFLLGECTRGINRLLERHGTFWQVLKYYYLGAWKTFCVPLVMLLTSFLSFFSDAKLAKDFIWKHLHVYIIGSIVMLASSWFSSKVEINNLSENVKMNIGEGLAWHYYLGYLKLLSKPPHPSSSNDVSTRMRRYEMTQDVSIRVKKVFILIPSSCMIHETLTVPGDENIEPANALDNLIISRSGTANRVYKNSVYKITTQSEGLFYCVAEGAPPCSILKDIAIRKMLTDEEIQEEVRIFYRTLQNLIKDDSDCCGYFKLVIYEEPKGKTEFISRVLEKAIHQEINEQTRSSA